MLGFGLFQVATAGASQLFCPFLLLASDLIFQHVGIERKWQREVQSLGQASPPKILHFKFPLKLLGAPAWVGKKLYMRFSAAIMLLESVST